MEDQRPPSRLGEYFANLPGDEIIGELRKRQQDYYKHLQSSGKLRRWEKSYLYYYGLDRRGMTSLDVNRSGEQGELSTIRVNEYRSLTQSLLTLTTSTEMAYETRALNTDYRAQTSTLIASSLLDYYQKEKGLSTALKSTAEYSLIFDEGFTYHPWDASLGDDVAADLERGVPIRAGDIAYSAKTPMDVIRDVRNRGKKHNWFVVKSWANRFDLAAENPEVADEILGASTARDRDIDSFLLEASLDDVSSDQICYFEFWHERTPAVPAGRFIRYVGDTVLDDQTLDELEYEQAPIARMSANEQTFSIFGYSNTLDLLAIQEALDTLYSTVLSNQSTFGVSNVWCKSQDVPRLTELSSGLNVLESEEQPQVLNLTSTPPEIFNFIQILQTAMERLSGVNSTVRGDPQSSLKSGAALALVASQSIQLMGNLNQAYEDLFERVGSATFKILQAKAKIARIIAITGKYQRSYIAEFTSKDISHICKIVVDRGNSITKTAAGRVELANTLLEAGKIPNAQEYLSVVTTGRLEPLTEGPMAALLLIRAENEALRDGTQAVPVLRGDDHNLHRAEHISLLSSPEARRNPDLVKAVLAHNDEHDRVEAEEAQRARNQQAALQGTPPQQQLPSPQQQGAPASIPVDTANPIVQDAQQVRMPTNPLTGQTFDPTAR